MSCTCAVAGQVQVSVMLAGREVLSEANTQSVMAEEQGTRTEDVTD